MPLSMYDILKTINQIATDSKDLPPPYNKKIGLKREEIGQGIQDRRIIDGFAVKFAGKTMRISYSSSRNIREMGEDFQNEIDEMIERIASFIKKEFNDETGSKLNLKRISEEPFIFVGVQGITEEDCRFTGYIDYEIKNKVSDEEADYEAKFTNAKHKSSKVKLNEGIKKLHKVISDKFKD